MQRLRRVRDHAAALRLQRLRRVRDRLGARVHHGHAGSGQHGLRHVGGWWWPRLLQELLLQQGGWRWGGWRDEVCHHCAGELLQEARRHSHGRPQRDVLAGEVLDYLDHLLDPLRYQLVGDVGRLRWSIPLWRLGDARDVEGGCAITAP